MTAAVLVGAMLPTLLPQAASAANLVETEPNTYRTSANVFGTGDSISGSSMGTSSNDLDWFAVDLPSAGRVALDLQFPSNLGAGDVYDVDVYTSDGSVLYHFDVTGNRYDGTWLRSFATYAPEGRLYIRINGQRTWASWGKTYTLRAGFTAGNVETEFNTYRTQPDVLTIGAATAGSSLGTSSNDLDWYAVDLPSAGRVALDLRFPSNLGAGDVYDVDVYTSDGSVLYHFDVNGNRYDGAWLRSFATYAPEGRLFIRINGQRTWASWGKTYTLSAGFTAGNVETEFNTYRTQPDVLTIGTATSGSSLGTSSNDLDWYAVDLSAAKRMSIALKFPSNLGAGDVYDVDVYDPDGRSLYHFDITGNKYSGSWLANQYVSLPAGRSYIRINGLRSATSWGKSYALTVRATLTKTPTPTTSGSYAVGKTIKAVPGTWAPTPVTFTYQWLRDGKAISGATSSSYKLVTADRGKKVSVKVTGSKPKYLSVAKTSAAKTIR